MAGVSRRKPLTILGAIKHGKKEMLEALRENVARTIDEGVPARDLASLTKRLMEIEDELAAVIVEEQGDVIGDATQIPDAPFTPSGGAHVRAS